MKELDEFNELAEIHKALSHPARLYILQFLMEQTCCYTGELTDILPFSQATISQHLKVLKDAGLIQGEIETPKIKYCLNLENWGKAKNQIELFLNENQGVAMKNILVLCTGNSCRSQLAEGYLRLFAGERAKIYSAGVETHGVNPRAVATMKEDGIDISGHTSNHVDEYKNINFDYIITVCDNAKERCPYFPTNAIKFHYNFPDPAKAKGTEDEIVSEFRNVRKMIREYCEKFIEDNLKNAC
jgi:arsenate reductase